MRYTTHAPEETRALAEILGHELGKTRPRTAGAFIVALSGDLGSGKTTFIQGFARGIGISRRLISPTFTIMRRYPLRGRAFRSLIHIDAYRVHAPHELSIIRFQEWLADPSAVILIEWADLVRPSLRAPALRVVFSHGKRENERTISIHR